MKFSEYNFVWDLENTDNILLYNSLTNCLVELNGVYRNFFEKNFNGNPTEIPDTSVFQELQTGGFIIEDDIDELSIVEFVYNSQKYSNDIKDITIAPTLNCNFGCIYCYEQDILSEQPSLMNEDTINDLVELFKREAQQAGTIAITWFGGEPLLAKETIISLSKQFIQIANEKGARYVSSMITNGYCISRDEHTLSMLRDCRIDGLQITIDGGPKIHNKRRPLLNSNEGTFDTIVKNVKFLHQNGVSVTIRVNVDKTNTDSIDELLDLLKEVGLSDVHINLGDVQTDTQGCKFYQKNCLSIKQFSLVERSFYKSLAAKGFKSGSSPPYPNLAYPCVANRVNSIIIDPDGDIYKCRADIGYKQEKIGNIQNTFQRTQDFRKREMKWITWSPFNNNACRKCKWIPICMGGCGHRLMFDKKLDCTEWKFNLEHFLRLRHMNTQKV